MTDSKIIQESKRAGEQDARYLSCMLQEGPSANAASAALIEALVGSVRLASLGREDEAMARIKSFTRHFGKELAEIYQEARHV